MLSEFLKLGKHPDNLPTPQVLFNLKYGCQYLLEPARREVGAIIVNSGYRNEVYNRQVGGVRNSQHLCPYTDQLLTGPGWLHISWTPFAAPRHFVRIGYYK